MRVHEHCRMDEGLVVDMLIQSRRLDLAIQDQHPAEFGALDHLDGLKLRLPGVQRTREGVAVELMAINLVDIVEP